MKCSICGMVDLITGDSDGLCGSCRNNKRLTLQSSINCRGWPVTPAGYNYRCPDCRGEFQTAVNNKCPFCGLYMKGLVNED